MLRKVAGRARADEIPPAGLRATILAAIAEPAETTYELTAEQAAGMVGEGAQLVDVRQDYEWEAGHISEAVHIPLEQLPARAESLGRDRAIIFQCRSGGRSAMTTAAFRESGFEAFNLGGGLLGWVAEGRPIEPSDGEVAGPRPDAT